MPLDILQLRLRLDEKQDIFQLLHLNTRWKVRNMSGLIAQSLCKRPVPPWSATRLLGKAMGPSIRLRSAWPLRRQSVSPGHLPSPSAEPASQQEFEAWQLRTGVTKSQGWGTQIGVVDVIENC